MAKKKKGGIRKAIKAAGPNISRSELKDIISVAGGNVTKAINQISNVGANLNSGAANMLIKAPPATGYGNTRLGQTLQSMAGTPSTVGRFVKGQQVGAVQGTPGTGLLPGGMMIRSGGRPAVRTQAAPAAPAAPAVGEATPVTPEPSSWGDDDGFDYDALLGDLMSMMPDYGAMFGNLQSQMAGMFDELSSQFDTTDPIQLAALGKAYGSDLIRARQRQRKTRTDYLRNQMNNMALGGSSAMAPLMIGGGVTL